MMTESPICITAGRSGWSSPVASNTRLKNLTRPATSSTTGLGFSICHSIVSSLQGRIEVASEPGKGSSFRVTLPVPAELSERVA
jgi:K+-sensing histidine kinase KdpD